MTAAIYARVSSARQKEEQTIASQTAALQAHAKAAGLEVPREWVFEDEGYSGATLIRPGLERLRDLAAEGSLGVVLCYSPDRLARRYVYQALLVEELARAGTEVRFLHGPKAETAEDHLLLQFQGMMAEYERAQIAERTRRGKRHRARAGVVAVLGGAPSGYRYRPRTEPGGAAYVVEETQAAVVREVLRRYVDDQVSLGALAADLTARGIPTARGGTVWERSVIWGMLRNPAYCGHAAFGKRAQIGERARMNRLSRRAGRRMSRRIARRERPREEWIEVAVPALVSEEQCALAARRLAANQRFALRRTKERSLLQGLLVCASCSHAIHRVNRRKPGGRLQYYRCLGANHRRFPNSGCVTRPIRQEQLDELVWQQVTALIADPALIRAELDRRIRELHAAPPVVARQAQLEREHARVQRVLHRLVDAYQNELLSLDELRTRSAALRAEDRELGRQLEALAAEAVDQQGHLQLAETLQSCLTKLGDSVRAAPLADRQRIVRLLVKEVVVGPDSILIRHSIPTPKREGDPEYRLRVGTGEHPLADRDERQHGFDEASCLLGHPPAAAAWADGSCLTGERDQALERAVVALHATEAPLEIAAAQEIPKLAFDEASHAGAVGGEGGLVEETREVRPHTLWSTVSAVDRGS
jgi:site-specific DNA recombinase